MPTLSVNVVDQCPDLLLQDTSDYSDQDVVGTYMFHDYVGAGAPTANTAFTLSSLTVNGVEVFQTADRIFKVSDTTNDKVNFELSSYGASTTLDCGGNNNTNFQFTKLKDL